MSDPERLQQILLNLITNAVKFTTTGGVVVDCVEDGAMVRVRVTDTGPGIGPLDLARVFEPFVQIDPHLTCATQRGVGLGLSISRELARGMGGSLTAESEIGVGSTFMLALPARPPEHGSPARVGWGGPACVPVLPARGAAPCARWVPRASLPAHLPSTSRSLRCIVASPLRSPLPRSAWSPRSSTRRHRSQRSQRSSRAACRSAHATSRSARDMPLAAVRDTMRSGRARWVWRCSHCHVAREGTPGTPAQTDYVSDEKAEKEMARRMMRMVQVINREHLDSLPWRAEPEIQVTCETCHRGLAEPRPLRQVLLGAYAAGGVDSVETRYRALRARFYGQAAYDFGDATLGEVAAALRARDRSADAMKIYLLNTRVLPNAPGAFRQLADAQLAAGDTAAAVTSLEQVVQLAPADAQAQRQLETLRRR
jgi:hypothetical protein